MGKHNFLRLIVLSMIVSLFLGMVFTQEANALPSWARKYNADCSLCQAPAVPRLNKTGQKFRGSGFRIPDEFGALQDVSNVGNFLSACGRGDGKFLIESVEGQRGLMAFFASFVGISDEDPEGLVACILQQKEEKL